MSVLRPFDGSYLCGLDKKAYPPKDKWWSNSLATKAFVAVVKQLLELVEVGHDSFDPLSSRWCQWRRWFMDVPKCLKDQILNEFFLNGKSFILDQGDCAPYSRETLSQIRMLGGQELFIIWWLFFDPDLSKMISATEVDIQFVIYLLNYVSKTPEPVNLKKANISYNWILHDEFRSMFEKMIQLKELHICSGLDNSLFVSLSSSKSPSLEKLSYKLPTYFDVKPESMASFLVRQSDTLVELDCRDWFSNLSDESLSNVVDKLKRLRVVRKLVINEIHEKLVTNLPPTVKELDVDFKTVTLPHGTKGKETIEWMTRIDPKIAVTARDLHLIHRAEGQFAYADGHWDGLKHVDNIKLIVHTDCIRRCPNIFKVIREARCVDVEFRCGCHVDFMGEPVIDDLSFPNATNVSLDLPMFEFHEDIIKGLFVNSPKLQVLKLRVNIVGYNNAPAEDDDRSAPNVKHVNFVNCNAGYSARTGNLFEWIFNACPNLEAFYSDFVTTNFGPIDESRFNNLFEIAKRRGFNFMYEF